MTLTSHLRVGRGCQRVPARDTRRAGSRAGVCPPSPARAAPAAARNPRLSFLDADPFNEFPRHSGRGGQEQTGIFKAGITEHSERLVVLVNGVPRPQCVRARLGHDGHAISYVIDERGDVGIDDMGRPRMIVETGRVTVRRE